MVNGVLSDTQLLYTNNGINFTTELNTSETNNLQRYLDIMLKYDLTYLWVHPKSSLSTSFENYDDSFFDDLQEKYFKPVHKDISPYITVEDKRGFKKKFMHLILPAYLSEDFPDKILESDNLLTLHAYSRLLEDLLGVPFTRDAKGTGIALLEKLHKFNDLWIPQIKKEPFYIHKQVDMQWSRPLTSEEKKYKYLHLIDVNMQYLSSTKGLKVGKGKCYFNQTNTFNKEYMGLWLVKLLNTTHLEAMGYPPLFPSPSPSFQTTELVSKAIDLGYKIEILGSYTFRSYWHMFTEWFNILQSSITKDKEIFKDDLVIKPFIKRLCNPMIGLMGREMEEGEKEKWYNRPDIYNSVVASSKAMLFTHLYQMALNNIFVVYIDVDAIGYLSNKPFEESLPDSVPVSSEIGHFKHSGTFKVKDVSKFCTTSIHTLKKRIKEVKANG